MRTAVHAKRETAETLPSVPVAEHESPERAEKAVQAHIDAESERDELLWLMSDKRGRRFMWRLLTRAGIYRTSFTGEALSAAFAEGKKQEGLHQMTLVSKHCLSRYIEMQKEAQSNERRKETQG